MRVEEKHTWPHTCLLNIALVIVVATTASNGAQAQSIANATVTEAEWAHAVAVGDVTVGRTRNLSGLGLGSVEKYDNIAYAPNVGKLFSVPARATAVLITDPIANTIDFNTLTLFQSSPSNLQWVGIEYAENVGKLFSAPFFAGAVLIIDPVTNATDMTTLSGFVGRCGRSLWGRTAYAPNVGKLFAPPSGSSTVLIIDPMTNMTDSTTLGGFDGSTDYKWSGIAFASNVGKLFASPSGRSPSSSGMPVLLIDPVTNTTDATTLVYTAKNNLNWWDLTYAHNTGKLYAAPMYEGAILIVDPVANTTDTIIVSEVPAGTASGQMWTSIAYAQNVGKLFASP